MAKTQLGQSVEGWSGTAKAEMRADLDKLTELPLDVLRTVIDKIAKTHPACNVGELCALEAEQHAVPDPQLLSDAISSFTYIWENMGHESAKAVSEDLSSLGLLSNGAARILTDLLVSAEPFRATARVVSANLRIGSPLFVEIRGTVDLRLRFHKSEGELVGGKLPAEIIDGQQVIMANLTINGPGNNEKVVSFLMDDNDLKYLKRFVRNMEKELELTKHLLPQSREKGNG
jgi:hypothetical protein